MGPATPPRFSSSETCDAYDDPIENLQRLRTSEKLEDVFYFQEKDTAVYLRTISDEPLCCRYADLVVNDAKAMRNWSCFAHWLCAISALLLGATGATNVAAQKVRVQNVQARQSDDTIVITYALEGNSEEAYQVDLKVSDDNGRSFSIEPSAVTGDVGEAVRPGRGKQITWNVLGDFSEGIEGRGYKFQVIGRKKQSSQFGIGVTSSLPLRGTENFGEDIGQICCFVGVSAEYNKGDTYFGAGVFTRGLQTRRGGNTGRSYGMGISLTYDLKLINFGVGGNFTYQNFEVRSRKLLTLQTKLGTRLSIGSKESITLRPSLVYDLFYSGIGDTRISNDFSLNWIYLEFGIIYEI